MPKQLTQSDVDTFRQTGFHFPIPVLARDEAAAIRARLEAYEATSGGPIAGNLRHKTHLLFPWAAELVRHPAILDAVEDLLGPDLLCWNSNFFIKEANNPAFVTWHQDATYWGLDPDDVVTAWVALSDAPAESGAMQFLPGSHRMGQLPHADTFHEHNLLSRGQEIAVQVDAEKAIPVPLKAGEMSLHHVKLAHYSGPNTTADRRIGLAIRYIPPAVRQRGVRDGATLSAATTPAATTTWNRRRWPTSTPPHGPPTRCPCRRRWRPCTPAPTRPNSAPEGSGRTAGNTARSPWRAASSHVPTLAGLG